MRLIDADKLYEKKYAELKDGEVLYRFTPRDIDTAETVNAVPVVRCRECARAEESVHPNTVVCVEHGKTMLESDFCSYGEKAN